MFEDLDSANREIARLSAEVDALTDRVCVACRKHAELRAQAKRLFREIDSANERAQQRRRSEIRRSH